MIIYNYVYLYNYTFLEGFDFGNLIFAIVHSSICLWHESLITLYYGPNQRF